MFLFKEDTISKERIRNVFCFYGVSLVIVAVLIIARYGLGMAPQCMVYNRLHLHCPSCGVTRMVDALIRGKFIDAFRYNMYFFISIPLALVFVVYQSVAYLRKGSFSKHMCDVLITWAILLIAFAVMRNTETFRFMAPAGI